ncbi:tetratricopeptide repeat protein [Bacillus sp. FSL M8-0266]|uniref:tetratricopeptide repeat protein n=1 Tax=Bacillus TaxID=1386 RepID=UPI00227E2B9D|nr:tetratricopeptide repeat protein [Bacillus pumilus]MCY7572129.1 tetratricopeptide repeat protein [Bacillus pumilus]MCY7575662.1 tetratricopeptide repeat protein [Bacillus pumilus]MEC3761811.1 tetratricopeptide repeat protein [Bacillus pumilus]
METKLEKAIELRKSGHHLESNEMLTHLVEEYPDDASIHYQCAWSYDLLGEERQAVFFYEKAIELGLSSGELEDALLGLGSTYRTLGEYEKSKQIFLKGIEAYPDNKAIQTFYAMTLYNLKEHKKAMEVLLNCLTETTTDPTILNYRKAIDFYSNQLDKLWK